MSERVDAGWPRVRVRSVAPPNWEALASQAPAWLLLQAADRPTLQEEVQALAGDFQHHWVWRGTPMEYEPPGYLQGPMLLQLNPALLEKFCHSWAEEQAGLILVGTAAHEPMRAQVLNLHEFTNAGGQPLRFGLHSLRTLEELCEALPAEQLACLFGPIQSFIWHSGKDQAEWLQADVPGGFASTADEVRPLVLSPDDEAALDAASYAWFLRHFAQLMTQRFPIFAAADNQLRLRRQLAVFAEEAAHFGFRLERDVRFYMELRLRYPQQALSQDAVVKSLLHQTSVQGLQRLFEISDRLSQTATPEI
ncbi:MAG: hypothetical protein LBE51_19630 [Acidovorax sp.]|jgi:hypothetical protein|nr:hypothetical protein [Acidovorax sp.]